MLCKKENEWRTLVCCGNVEKSGLHRAKSSPLGATEQEKKETHAHARAHGHTHTPTHTHTHTVHTYMSRSRRNIRRHQSSTLGIAARLQPWAAAARRRFVVHPSLRFLLQGDQSLVKLSFLLPAKTNSLNGM